MVGVNLIPKAVQLAQARRRHMNRWGVSILAAAALLAVPSTIDWLQRAEATELRTRNANLQIELAAAGTRLRAQTAQANETLLQLERARALRSKRAWSAMFAMIGRCMPAGCWLTSVATDPATPPAASRGATASRKGADEGNPQTIVIEAPRKLRVAGYATDVAEPHGFVANLKDTGVFTDVVLEHSRREPALDGYYFRFELVCEW